MMSDTTTSDSAQPVEQATADFPELFDNWLEPLESAIRERVRGLIGEHLNFAVDLFAKRGELIHGRGALRHRIAVAEMSEVRPRLLMS